MKPENQAFLEDVIEISEFGVTREELLEYQRDEAYAIAEQAIAVAQEINERAMDRILATHRPAEAA